MIRTHDVDAALRTLDPGDRHVDPTSPRARADLHRILATDRSLAPERPTHPASTRSTAPPRRTPRTARRLVLAGAVLAIAERRGAWDTVILTSPSGFSAMCTTDSNAGFLQGGTVGYVGTASDHVDPGPRGLSVMSMGVATLDSHDLSTVAGEAGPDVTGVLYRSTAYGNVAATVSGGYFALWFPGDELRYADPTHPVEVDVTYADGTTATVPLSF